MSDSLEKIGIYKITSPSGKIYIGQSTDIYKRWKEYKRLDCKSQRVLYNSLKKYGPDAHVFKIVKLCPVDELNKWERHYQLYYAERAYKMLNLRIQKAEGNSGTLSDETKKKISEAHKGKKLSPEHRRKLSEAYQNMSEALKGNINRKGKGKIIECYDLAGNFVKSAKYDVFIKEGFSNGNISQVCNGKLKAYKGFIFRFAS